MCALSMLKLKESGGMFPHKMFDLDVLKLLLRPFVELNSIRTTNIHINMNSYFPAHCALQQALVLASQSIT